MSSPPPTLADADGEGETRDWSEMPSDMLCAVFRKLNVAELLTGAGLVCRAWRRLAATDPTLWRRVDLCHQGYLLVIEEGEAMARAAVDRAAGTMEAFWADIFVTDNLLSYISQRASSLKSLQLILCHMVSKKGLLEAIKGFPELEELDISFCSLYGSECEAIGKACPQLKCFRLNEFWTILHSEFAAYQGMGDDTEALGIASTMSGLQDLQLIGNKLTNDGLMAILDHCPHLESLDIRRCYYIRLDDALKSKCARIKNIKLPWDPINDLQDVVTEYNNAYFDDFYGFENDVGTFDYESDSW